MYSMGAILLFILYITKVINLIISEAGDGL